MTSKAEVIARWRKPMIMEDEVVRLTKRYGEPLRRTSRLPADNYTRQFRFDGRIDRRAEVVFAIQDPSGGVWVHSKRNYPANVYRLPTGGVGWLEGVESALLREIAEETALRVRVERFLGLVRYEFFDDKQVAEFASYIFQVRSSGGAPRPETGEEITDFRQVTPVQLAEVASNLRNLEGDRHGWGQWRAIAHDLVHEAMVKGK